MPPQSIRPGTETTVAGVRKGPPWAARVKRAGWRGQRTPTLIRRLDTLQGMIVYE